MSTIVLFYRMNIKFQGITMKKNTIIFNLVAAILCGFTAPAAADFCGQNYNDCCEWSLLDGKVSVGADWLYWKVQQDGVLPGSVVTTTTVDSLTTTSSRRSHPSFKWDSGFRVNLGYELPCDCWDVNLAYTYIPSHARINNFVADAETVRFVPVDGASFAAYTSKWDFNGNNIDLDLGRTVAFGECLTVRPHVGFRTTWFDQKFRSVGINGDVTQTATIATTSIKEKFQGYGVEAGLWTDYKLGCGVSLVGHFGGSILYSKFKINSTAVSALVVENAETITAIDYSSESFYAATPSVDYFIGLQYADTLCDTIFKARLGWEQHVLFDTNRYLSSGNLSTQGLTLGVDVGF